jgi:hypothetical protein
MRKQAPTIEWQIVESDEAWERLCALPSLAMPPGATPSPGRPSIQRLIAGVMLPLLLTGALGWWWQSLHADVKATTAPSLGAVEQCSDTPASSQSDTNLWYQSAQKYNGILAEPFKIPLNRDLAVVEVNTGCSGAP